MQQKTIYKGGGIFSMKIVCMKLYKNRGLFFGFSCNLKIRKIEMLKILSPIITSNFIKTTKKIIKMKKYYLTKSLPKMR
jgi:hypothetical protein